jgi:hypothetical protein
MKPSELILMLVSAAKERANAAATQATAVVNSRGYMVLSFCGALGASDEGGGFREISVFSDTEGLKNLLTGKPLFAGIILQGRCGSDNVL